MEFKIKIEEEFNKGNKHVGEWFVKYEHPKPIFTKNEDEAGIFVLDFAAFNAVYGNLMALEDRYGIKGTPIDI
jgi:hypothetical protein